MTPCSPGWTRTRKLQRDGRSAVLRRAADEAYPRRRRKRSIAESYRPWLRPCPRSAPSSRAGSTRAYGQSREPRRDLDLPLQGARQAATGSGALPPGSDSAAPHGHGRACHLHTPWPAERSTRRHEGRLEDPTLPSIWITCRRSSAPDSSRSLARSTLRRCGTRVAPSRSRRVVRTDPQNFLFVPSDASHSADRVAVCARFSAG